MASPVPRDRQPGPPGPDADAAQAEPAQQGGADASMAEALGLRGGELMDSITNAVRCLIGCYSFSVMRGPATRHRAPC